VRCAIFCKGIGHSFVGSGACLIYPRETSTAFFLGRKLHTLRSIADLTAKRMPISQYLRDCGYKVIEAANAEEAMSVLSHRETNIDFVFTDIEMPGAGWIWIGQVGARTQARLRSDIGRKPTAHRRTGKRTV
jgi:hypothetical protein